MELTIITPASRSGLLLTEAARSIKELAHLRKGQLQWIIASDGP